MCREFGRLPSELAGRTRYTVEVRGPRWLRDLCARITVRKDYGLTVDDVRELEALRLVEAQDEADRAAALAATGE